MTRFLIGAVTAFVLLIAPAMAAPKFPPLSGRVVDDAHILSSAAESELAGKLANLETTTGRQLVVATLPSLQGYEIEEYGYQLGRAWGIGSKDDDNGVLFIVAPKERKVRIEVGYGLEPILTDAMSSYILQGQVLPKFKAGDLEGGVVAGADALIGQLAAPEGEAKAAVAQLSQQRSHASPWPFAPFVPIIIIFIIFSILRGLGRRGRGRGGLGGGILPWIILGALNSRGGSGGGWSSGGGGWLGGGGGGGFSGGGGSFGGGGSSGSW